MQEITTPKVKSIADQILELPLNSAVVVMRESTAGTDAPYDFILSTGANGWVAGRGRHPEKRYLNEDDIRSLVARYQHLEYRFFELYNPVYGWAATS